jgi:hypothetical protein
MLYRAFDFFADSRYAAGQTGGGTVCAIVAGFPLCDFRPARTAGGLCELAAE